MISKISILNRGFTLVELLVTVAMVGALSAGVMVMIGRGPRESARDGRRQADLEKVGSALELMRNDNGGYPQCAGGAVSCVLSGVSWGTYLTAVPTDPLGAPRQYAYRPFDSGGGQCSGGDRCTTFSLCAGLERNLVAVTGNPACGSCGGGINCSWRTTNP